MQNDLSVYTPSNISRCQVLFEKLHLHERCENKKLPKTLLKQQQSTSEAVVHTYPHKRSLHFTNYKPP